MFYSGGWAWHTWYSPRERERANGHNLICWFFCVYDELWASPEPRPSHIIWLSHMTFFNLEPSCFISFPFLLHIIRTWTLINHIIKSSIYRGEMSRSRIDAILSTFVAVHPHETSALLHSSSCFFFVSLSELLLCFSYIFQSLCLIALLS